MTPSATPTTHHTARAAPLLAMLAVAAASTPAHGQGPEGEPAPPSREALAEQRIILVTGSTGGLGREVAVSLAEPGVHLIVHGRDRERGLGVVEAATDAGATATFYAADLATVDAVRGLGEALLRDYPHLDVLVNNAGIWLSGDEERYLTDDGYELSLAVNYLSGFLLTHMLLPIIPAGPDSRIVNVASVAQTPIDFDDPMMEEGYSGGRSYGQSKLAQIMFTFDLAEQVADRGIVVNALHPATLMDTDMVFEAGVQPRSTVEEGRDAVLNLVRTPGLESGQYFDGLEPSRANAFAYDEEARARLRELSEELVGF